MTDCDYINDDDDPCAMDCSDEKDTSSCTNVGRDSVKDEILSLNEVRRRDWRTFRSELEAKCHLRAEERRHREDSQSRKQSGKTTGKSKDKKIHDDTPKSLIRPLISSPKPVTLDSKSVNKDAKKRLSTQQSYKPTTIGKVNPNKVSKSKGTSKSKPNSKSTKPEGIQQKKSKSKSGSQNIEISTRSKSRGRSKGRSSSKIVKKSKSRDRSLSNKKPRGRSRVKGSVKEHRNPPPTPISYDGRKSQSQYISKLEKFNKTRFDADLEEITRVNELRGYSSEPEIEVPCKMKFKMKKMQHSTVKAKPPVVKSKSLEDIFISSTDENVSMVMNFPCYDDGDFNEFVFSQNVWNKWHNAFELEKNRFSFFDELWAQKYVTDSMEVPRYAHDVTYLIEAETTDYRSKVDYGRLVFKSKNVFTGNLADWYFQGPGRYCYLQGEVYQGEFCNNVPHGPGMFLWTDGSIYEGNFYFGLRKGWGIYTMSQNYTYAGEWNAGFPHGKGKVWYDPLKNYGDYYDGEFLNGQSHGFGTRQYKNGDRYVGTWANGKRDGTGTMIWKEKVQLYKGEWKEGLTHGMGMHVWFTTSVNNTNSNSLATNLRYIFKGEYQNGSRNGAGKLIFPNGSIYQGFWENGKQIGEGKFIDPAGELLASLSCSDLREFGTTEFVIDRAMYECIFEKLIKELKTKNENYPFMSPIDEERLTEARELTNICFKYLNELQLLYKRAGDLGEKWSNHSFTSKSIHRKRRNKCFTQKTKSFSANMEAFHNMFANKGDLNSVTRFGLWLLIKDCQNIVSNATMAYFDKKWVKKKKTQYKTEVKDENAKNLPTSNPETKEGEKTFDAASESMKSTPKTSLRGKQGKGSIDSTASSKNSKGERRKGSTKKTPKKSITNSSSTKRKKSSLSKTESIDEENELPKESSEDTLATPTTTMSSLSEEQTKLETSQLEHIISESDIFVQNDEEKGMTASPTSISEIFERLLNEVLLPCFERQAGKLLPEIPSPLPPLVDLFRAFKSIKNSEVITALDFLYTILPHQIYPDRLNNKIYWHRSKQILSPFINYDYLFELPQQVKKEQSQTKRNIDSYMTDQRPTPEREWMEDELYTNSHDNFSTGKKVSKKGSEAQKVKDEKESIEDKIQDKELSGEEETTTTNEENPPLYCDDVLAELDRKAEEVKNKPKVMEEFKKNTYDEDGIPYIEIELMSEQSQKAQPNIEIKKNSALKNLESDDVTAVLSYMYPDLCGVPGNCNLNFEMIFCDWLWCLSLCSRISIEKERELTGKVKSTAFRFSYTKNTLEKGNMEQMHCLQCNYRGSTEKFFKEYVLDTFLKHQEIRHGEKLTNEQNGGGDVNFSSIVNQAELVETSTDQQNDVQI